MALWLRITISIVFGGAVALVLILAAGSGELSQPVKDALLWNVNLFVKMAGNGPLLGYDAQGNPRYEGTPVHMFFALLGLASTFPIYMVITYIILSIGNKLWGSAQAAS